MRTLIVVFAAVAALVIHIILCGRKNRYCGMIIPAVYVICAAVAAIMHMDTFRISDLTGMLIPLFILVIILYIRRRFTGRK